MKVRTHIIICLIIAGMSMVLGEDGRIKFESPIWHPDACWDAKFITVVGSGVVGQQDGPKREIMSGVAIGTEAGRRFYLPNLTILPSAAGPYGCLSYDPKLDRVHFVAGSARGYLDGPFSRARFGGHSYSQRVRSACAGHLYYRTELENGDVLRCLDFKK